MVALPDRLFYTTPIAVCLWFLTRNKRNGRSTDRRRQTLFIDARSMGTIEERKYRSLSDDEIARISRTYDAWRGKAGAYADVPGFCASVSTDQIAAHGYKLTVGPYVGSPEVETDDVPFDERMRELCDKLGQQFQESAKLEKAVRLSLRSVGYDI